MELPAAAGGVLQEEAVDDERTHDAEEADEEPDEVGGLGLGRAASGLAGVGGGVRIFRRRPVQVVGSHSPLAAVLAEFANVLSAATAAAHNCLVVVIVVEGIAAAVVLVVAIRRPSFAAGSGAALSPVRERSGPGRPAAGHHDRRCRCHLLGGRPRLGIVRAAAAVRRAPGAAAAAALGGRRRGLPGKVVVLPAVGGGGRRGRRRCRRVISGRARARRLLALAGAVAALVPSPSIPASGGLLLAAGGGSSGREDPWLLRAHLVLRSIVRSTARDVLITAMVMVPVAWTVERHDRRSRVRQSNESNRKFGCKRGKQQCDARKSKGEKRGTWRCRETRPTRPADTIRPTKRRARPT